MALSSWRKLQQLLCLRSVNQLSLKTLSESKSISKGADCFQFQLKTKLNLIKPKARAKAKLSLSQSCPHCHIHTSPHLTAALVHVKKSNQREIPAPILERTLKTKVSSSEKSAGPEQDWIGPPNTASNIRPLKLRQQENDTPLEAQLRAEKLEVVQFNHKFWSQHNKSFSEGKEAFVASRLEQKAARGVKGEDAIVTAEEMSEFYKAFLDNNFKHNWNYNLNMINGADARFDIYMHQC